LFLVLRGILLSAFFWEHECSAFFCATDKLLQDRYHLIYLTTIGGVQENKQVIAPPHKCVIGWGYGALVIIRNLCGAPERL